jgi:hypothetical protein
MHLSMIAEKEHIPSLVVKLSSTCTLTAEIRGHWRLFEISNYVTLILKPIFCLVYN